MYSPSIELLAGRIDDFNEKYGLVENEKAVFSIEYAAFHWDAGGNTGTLSGNRYGLVRLCRDITLTAAISGKGGPPRQSATRFAEGSDEIIILKKKPSRDLDEPARFEWDEHGHSGFPPSETSYLEGILESLDRAALACAPENALARVDWDLYNRAAFLTGTSRGLLLLASEVIRFTLSASLGDRHEVSSLDGDGGSLVLEFKEEE